MKKNILTLALAVFAVSISLKAQSPWPCNTFDAMDQVFKADPSAKVRYDKAQEELRLAVEAYEKSLTLGKTAAVQYTIPVVFHVLHVGGPENIADANLINALAQINSDYAKAGSDVGTISPLFSSLYIPVDIKFMLAHKDPAGNCTSGIVHYYNTNTDWQQNAYPYPYTGTTAGKWNPTKYLNIYIVRSICASTPTCSTSGGTIVGYTYKPGTWSSGAAQDAIAYNYQFLGGLQARSLSHEIGHWLNLSHTFGNTNSPGITCGDDGISDTPPTKGYFSTCPPSAGGNVCDVSTNANVENIMDYSSCPKMFTQGQTNVMRTAAASGISGRSNLITPANLTATDVNGSGICAPTAAMQAPTYTVCSGGTLTFSDISFNGTVTARSWAVTGGGIIGNPNGTPTSITFPTIGVQTVTLVAGNASGTTTATHTVTVLNGVPNYTNTYSESFEGATSFANWTVYNPSGGVTWSVYSGAGATGVQSYYIDGSIDPTGAVDILESPSYDFLNNPGATFTFKYAYARANATNVDVFKCQVSSNCGGTWTDIVFGTNAVLCNLSGGTTSTPFVPSSAQFKLYTLTSHPGFNPFKTQPNVHIRWYFQEDPTAGFGNNVFLDDVNFSAPLGVNALTKSIGFNVYPNPTNGSANIEFTLSDPASIKYFVCDVVGKVVETEKTSEMGVGTHTVTINESQKLKAGVYFVNFELNGQRMSRKLIIE